MDFLGVMDRETARSRSSTWPLPDPTQLKVEMEEGEGEKRETPECESPVPQAPKSEPKKMRNAWGNMSYAELITQAILTAPETKLTLSEIYDWIVHNVPYFADKANSPSTAGWKVCHPIKLMTISCSLACRCVCENVQSHNRCRFIYSFSLSENAPSHNRCTTHDSLSFL